MNNKDYLNQIASEARPLEKKAPGFLGKTLNLSMKQLKIIGAIIASMVLVLIIGLIATSGNSNSERGYVDAAYLRSNDLSSIIDSYRTQIRSSNLRSISMSLKSVLSETSFILVNALVSDFGVKEPNKSFKNSTIEKETAVMGELTSALEVARLNALLDRVYAHEMTYQISLLISLETDVINRTKKEPFKTNLTSARTNLEAIHSEFSSFVAN